MHLPALTSNAATGYFNHWAAQSIVNLAPLLITLVASPVLAGPLRPACEAIESFAASPPPGASSRHFRDFTITRTELCTILATYFEVAQEQWLHAYHHVAFEDRIGTITLKDGVVLKWLVRPGGLATLSYPDGVVLFLAKDKHR
jgi:hypothetical protein